MSSGQNKVMTQLADRILEDALTLPERQRVQMASELLASVKPPLDLLEENSPEFVAEIQRRADAVLRGESESVSWEEAKRIVAEHLRSS